MWNIKNEEEWDTKWDVDKEIDDLITKPLDEEDKFINDLISLNCGKSPDINTPISKTQEKKGILNFQPKHHKSKIRLDIIITNKDYQKYKEANRNDWTEITDLTHNAQILVQQAPCNLENCYCDAIYKLKD